MPFAAKAINHSGVNREADNASGECTGFSPGRVEWLGNHTDYNDGLVLGLGLNVGATVRARPRADSLLRLSAADLGRQCEVSIDTLNPVVEEPWANYFLGVAAGFIARGAKPCGLDVVMHSDVPMGAGLSSSAALECASARMLQQSWGTKFDELELARIGQEAEHLFAGVRCGLLDQVVSLFARRGHAVFLDCRSLHIERVPVPDDARFVIVQSGVKHALVDGAYNVRRAQCEEAARILGVEKLRGADMAMVDKAAAEGRLANEPLRRARHVVGENARVLRAVDDLRRGNLEALGVAMNESHESSRTLFENSCPEIDFLVAQAREIPGCLGARLTGGGFGGAILALVRAGSEDGFVGMIKKRAAPELGHEPQVMVTTAGGA